MHNDDNDDSRSQAVRHLVDTLKRPLPDRERISTLVEPYTLAALSHEADRRNERTTSKLVRSTAASVAADLLDRWADRQRRRAQADAMTGPQPIVEG
ncbi:MAG: hypothetical protein AAF657_14010 [Acidobacteriota bacterium]